MRHIFLVLVALFVAAAALAQGSDPYTTVLQKNRIGRAYIFDSSRKPDNNRLELTFLGTLRSENGKHYKILVSRWYWGYARHATSRICVYSMKNECIGRYTMSMSHELPLKIARNALVFIKHPDTRPGCTGPAISYERFSAGPPEYIVVNCDQKPFNPCH